MIKQKYARTETKLNVILIIMLISGLFAVPERIANLSCDFNREASLLLFLKDKTRSNKEFHISYNRKQCDSTQSLRFNGLYEFYLGDKQLGIKNLSELYVLRQGDPFGTLHLWLVARYYQEQGDFLTAIPLFLEIGDAASLMDIGTLTRTTGDWQIALYSFDSALKTQNLGGNTYLAHFLMAKIWWYGLRDFEKAKQDFVTAHHLKPDDFYVCRDAAEVWSQAGFSDELAGMLPYCKY
jgi:tetratricopeptide (TPR) repeat protein